MLPGGLKKCSRYLACMFFCYYEVLFTNSNIYYVIITFLLLFNECNVQPYFAVSVLQTLNVGTRGGRIDTTDTKSCFEYRRSPAPSGGPPWDFISEEI